LNHYLKTQVNQDIRKRFATCFVAVDEQENVIGYYTLTSQSLGREAIPQTYIKQVPASYNAPAILLGRLARDRKFAGKGLGESLLMDALFRSYRISEKSIGAMAVVVDPINDSALKFYEKYGFQLLPDSGKMFLPMKVIGKLM
jgi:ribosomal protein S18 acetylase RimI-like enzyme